MTLNLVGQRLHLCWQATQGSLSRAGKIGTRTGSVAEPRRNKQAGGARDGSCSPGVFRGLLRCNGCQWLPSGALTIGVQQTKARRICCRGRASLAIGSTVSSGSSRNSELRYGTPEWVAIPKHRGLQSWAAACGSINGGHNEAQQMAILGDGLCVGSVSCGRVWCIAACIYFYAANGSDGHKHGD
jgi:hypothetical protein